jgi:MFS family permease
MIGFMSRVVLTILPIFVGEYASFSLVGTALGWYNAIGFLGSAVGPYIFGLIADIYGFNLAFLVVGVMTSISIPLIIMVRK